MMSESSEGSKSRPKKPAAVHASGQAIERAAVRVVVGESRATRPNSPSVTSSRALTLEAACVAKIISVNARRAMARPDAKDEKRRRVGSLRARRALGEHL